MRLCITAIAVLPSFSVKVASTVEGVSTPLVFQVKADILPRTRPNPHAFIAPVIGVGHTLFGGIATEERILARLGEGVVHALGAGCDRFGHTDVVALGETILFVDDVTRGFVFDPDGRLSDWRGLSEL